MKKWLALALALCLALGGAALALAEAETPELLILSDIVGLVDTFGKTSAKNYTIFSSGPGDQTIRYYNEAEERVAYEDQDVLRKNPGVSYVGAALFVLDGADNSLIDSGSATVRLVDSSMCQAEDYILSEAASRLTGEWVDGVYTYTLTGDDIQFNQYKMGHALINPNVGEANSGFEWSTMGGDGNGVYYLNLEVSGITYNGVELAAKVFPVTVFCYGRENSMSRSAFLVEYEPLPVDAGYASGVAATDAVQWNWFTENAAAVEPYMNDTCTDYLTVIWPEGTDASALEADDVIVTLADAYGETRILLPVNPYGEQEYTVLTRPEETTIAVTYEQWSWYPAYCSLTVSIDSGNLQAENTFTISSVNGQHSMAQQGGGEQNGVPYITARTYNGITGWELGRGIEVSYTLSTEVDGKTYYYDGQQLVDADTLPQKESAGWGGNVSMVTDLEAVSTYITSEDDDPYGVLTNRYISVDGGHTYCTGTNLTDDMYVDVEIDGTTYALLVTATVSTENAFTAEFLRPGYNLQSTAQSKWAYPMRFQSGWLQSGSPKPTGSPYVYYYYGFTPEEGSNPCYAEAVADALNAASAPSDSDGFGGSDGGPSSGGQSK